MKLESDFITFKIAIFEARITSFSVKLSLILFGLLYFHSALAQKNFVEGYIINLKSDTIHGFIDYQNWKFPPDKIVFKNAKNAQSSSYRPTTIKEFGAENDIYIGGIVDTEISSSKTNRLSKVRKPNIRADTTFLQTLIRGEKSLYFYKNSNGKENFYISLDSTLQLLVEKKYLRNEDNKSVIANNNQYKSQLRQYLFDCPNIQSKISSIDYTSSSLIKLFDYYYLHIGKSDYYVIKEEKTSTKFGVFVGLSSTSLTFKGGGFDYLVNTDFSSSNDLVAGISFEVIFPRNFKKLSLYNEIAYSQYSFNGQYLDFESENRNTTYTTELSYSYLKINNLVRYKFSTEKFIPYVNAGLTNGSAIGETNYRKEDSVFYNFENTVIGKALDVTKSWEIGLAVGLGMKYDKISFEIRYDQGNGMSRYLELSSTTERFSFLFGYQF